MQSNFTGVIKRERIAQGSKSDREAVVLDVPGRVPLTLRKIGTPPFGDTTFDHLIGQKVTVSGVLTHATLLVQSLNDVKLANSGPGFTP